MPKLEPVVFVSDLHISSSEPEIERRFIRLLAKLNNTKKLYILGDWFDIWLRDSINLGEFPDLVQSLKAASAAGLKIYFMPGNRDFLLGKKFARQTGVKIISDPHQINLGGKTVLLTHGDRLCTDDKSYQLYMRIIQNPVVKFILQILPAGVLKSIGNKLKLTSNASKNKKAAYIMDVNQDALNRVFKNVDVLIHGHTHKPGAHNYADKLRLVMSDWSQDAQIVIFNGQNIELVFEHQI